MAEKGINLENPGEFAEQLATALVAALRADETLPLKTSLARVLGIDSDGKMARRSGDFYTKAEVDELTAGILTDTEPTYSFRKFVSEGQWAGILSGEMDESLSVQMQEAEDYISERGGGRLVYPPGVIPVDGYKGAETTYDANRKGGLYIMGGVYHIGVPGKTIWRNIADDWRCMVRIRQGENFGFEGIVFDGDRYNHAPVDLDDDDVRGELLIFGDEVSPLKNVSVRLCHFMRSGHYGMGLQNIGIENFLLENCTGYDFGGDGIDIKHYEVFPKIGVTIRGNRFGKVGSNWQARVADGDGAQAAFDLRGPILFEGNTAYDIDSYDDTQVGNEGIRVNVNVPSEASGRIGGRMSRLVNNFAFGTKADGVGGGSGPKRTRGLVVGAENVSVTGMYIEGFYHGAYVDLFGSPGIAEGEPHNTSLSGIHVKRCNGAGETGVGLLIGAGVFGCHVQATIEECDIGASGDFQSSKLDLTLKNNTIGHTFDSNVMRLNDFNFRYISNDSDSTFAEDRNSLRDTLKVWAEKTPKIVIQSTFDSNTWPVPYSMGGLYAEKLDTSGNGDGFVGSIQYRFAGITGANGGWYLDSVDGVSGDPVPVAWFKHDAITMFQPFCLWPAAFVPTTSGDPGIHGQVAFEPGKLHIASSPDSWDTYLTASEYTDSQLVNQPTDIGRPLYVRSTKDWLDLCGVMAGPTPEGIEQAIAEAVATGRRVFIPPGDFTFTSQITIASLSRPLRLELDPMARIIADATLTDGFIKVNDGGDFAVEIEGGQWIADDQPKPVLPDSWALVSLTNVKGGGLYRCRFQAGADYRDEKSDSAVFFVGEDFSIDKCSFRGFYDSGIYSSGSGSGTGNFGVKVTDSDFYGCAVGFITKRLSSASILANNTFKRCRNGIATGHALEQQPAGKLLTATGNHLHDCRSPFYLVWAHDSVITGNTVNGWGFDAADVVDSGAAAIRLLGTQNAKIIGNKCKNSTPESSLHGIRLEQNAYTASGGGVTTNQSTYNTISDNDLDGGSGCNRAMYEANSSDHNTFSMNNIFGTWTNDIIMVGANTLCIRKTSAGKLVTTYQNTETLVSDDDYFDVKPSASGALRVFRSGSTDQYLLFYSTSGGHRLQGMCDAASAKNNFYDSDADGPVTGGELGHTWRISGATKVKVTNTKLSIDMSLLGNYADDAAAAAGSVAVGEAYRTGSILKFRVA